MGEEGSKAFTLNWSDVWSVGKSALLVGGAAGLTVVAQNLHVVDMGAYGPLIVPVVSIALDTVIKWMKNNGPVKN
jgi:hypothetical protein